MYFKHKEWSVEHDTNAKDKEQHLSKWRINNKKKDNGWKRKEKNSAMLSTGGLQLANLQQIVGINSLNVGHC